MNIYFFDCEDWELAQLETLCKELKPTLLQSPITQENVSGFKDAEIISIFLTSHITREMIAQLPNLKLITTRSTGYDQIDIKAAQERGITVCNVPHYGEYTVAEYTFGLILALSRKIVTAVESVKKYEFSCTGLMGFDLHEKTIGVVGTGNIGTNVIKIAKGFGMNVIAYDAYPNLEKAHELGFTYARSLNELLSQSDIITLHVPYMPQTHHLINKENIALIKPGALLINTARGAVVETEALMQALDTGILAGAGLDVLEGESALKEERSILTQACDYDLLRLLVANHALINKQNVIVTPHNAFNSIQARQRILQTTNDIICDFIAGKPTHVVQ